MRAGATPVTDDIWSGAVPSAGGLWLTPAGQTWDAVRLPSQLGLCALSAVPGKLGAVLMAPHSRRMYFLVPPRTTTSWNLPHSTALSEADHVALPPAHRGRPPGPHWFIPPRHGRVHTRTDQLHAAVQVALGLRPGRPQEDQPNLAGLSLDQVQGRNCALCNAPLVRARRTGTFCTGTGLLTEPVELWSCEPRCGPHH